MPAAYAHAARPDDQPFSTMAAAAAAPVTAAAGPPLLLRQKYDLVMKPTYPISTVEAAARLNSLRRLILLRGRRGTFCTLRGHVWKMLLMVDTVSAKDYAALVALGPSEVQDKIRYRRDQQPRVLASHD